MIESAIGIVMNVDVVTGIIVAMKMDLKNNWSHGIKMDETADIKSTGNGDLTAKSANL